MKERVMFVLEWERRWKAGAGRLNFAELCREFGISRQVGYVDGEALLVRRRWRIQAARDQQRCQRDALRGTNRDYFRRMLSIFLPRASSSMSLSM
jgi:hypothetical protein